MSVMAGRHSGIGVRMSTDVSSGGMPNPARAGNVVEFVAMMRELRSWASLTYAELESKARAAGDKLPQSTIASALCRESLPRESTVASFVRACGGDVHVVDAWLVARRRVASVDEDVGNLAYAVEAWLTNRRRRFVGSAPVPRPRPEHRPADAPLVTQNYAEGRVARQAAESNSDRWKGVHRRVNRDGPLGLRRLATLIKQRTSKLAAPQTKQLQPGKQLQLRRESHA